MDKCNIEIFLFHVFVIFQNTPTLPENPISKVTTGLSGSKCNLPHSFECVEDRSADGDKKFMGSLFIGNLCIARAEDKLKKMCKQETFQQVRR